MTNRERRMSNDHRRQLMNVTHASTAMPPSANLLSVKAALKNAKAARDFEAMLLTPLLDSLQKTFAGDSGDSKTPGSKRLSPDGNPGAGPVHGRPRGDW